MSVLASCAHRRCAGPRGRRLLERVWSWRLRPARTRLACVAGMWGGLVVPAALPASAGAATPASSDGASAVPYGDAFWAHWGDGRAEIATYDLMVSRYGQPRAGLAVAIFVTETFSNALRVKADPGKHPAADEFPVMKLNLVEDFPTGIYDYNLMCSSFVALAPVNGRPAGAPTKVSFSSQEWCGHVWQQMLFDERTVRLAAHSYFDGEADHQDALEYPAEGIAEDALMLWARGLAWPALRPGESREVPLLRSAIVARLAHVPCVWQRAQLSRSGSVQQLTVPAGTFSVEVWSASVENERAWAFYVEQQPPHRIVQWERSDGQSAVLVKAERLKYWEMNGPSFVSGLGQLGLQPRPARTP